MHRVIVAALLAPLAMAGAAAADERARQLNYGEQLAQECVACHRRDGKDEGIPGIVNMSEEDMYAALLLYKTGRRRNKVMVSVAASMDDEQMKAVSAYLVSARKQGAGAVPAPKPVQVR